MHENRGNGLKDEVLLGDLSQRGHQDKGVLWAGAAGRGSEVPQRFQAVLLP